MDTLLALRQLLKALILPPTGPLLAAFIALLLAERYPRSGRWVALAGFSTVLLLSLPIVSTLLLLTLDRTQTIDLRKHSDAQAIVVLGGGVRRHASEFGGSTLGGLTLERVRYGARVARATGLPVLVSGGAQKDMPAEAPLMRDALVKEYGVPVRWVESQSRNTHENAVNSSALLKASGINRVILVGHSFDFPRTRYEFEAAGIGVIPAPIATATWEPITLGDFVPGLGGLQRSYFATYELLANAAYWISNGSRNMPSAVGASQ